MQFKFLTVFAVCGLLVWCCVLLYIDDCITTAINLVYLQILHKAGLRNLGAYPKNPVDFTEKVYCVNPPKTHKNTVNFVHFLFLVPE